MVVNHPIAWVILSIALVYPGMMFWRRVDFMGAMQNSLTTSVPMIIRLLPYLMMMIVAVGMLRAAGVFDLLALWLGPLMNQLGIPMPVLPLAILRPFSGSAAYGVFTDITTTYGPNSFVAHLAATMIGSTETTFYVVAVYFGSVKIRRTRHAIPAGLIADMVGIWAAIVVCRLMLG